jgi:hypothetical protein
MVCVCVFVHVERPQKIRLYEFSHPFEPPVEACTSFYVGILSQKATQLGKLLDPGW